MVQAPEPKRKRVKCRVIITTGKMPEKRICSFYQYLLQLLVLAILLRSSQQQGTSRSWDRVSRLVPNSLYERRDDVVSSSSGNRQAADAPLLHLLEENNVMEASKIDIVKNKDEEEEEEEEEEEGEMENSSNDRKEQEHGDEEYNDEYEIESHHAGEKDSSESSLKTQDDMRNQIPTNSTKISLPEHEHSREQEDYLSEEEEEEIEEEHQHQQDQEEEEEEPEIHDDSYIYYDDNENNSSLYEALDSLEVAPEDKATNLNKNSSNKGVETEEASLKRILSSEYSVNDEEDKDSEASEIEEINTDGSASREDGNKNDSIIDVSSKDSQNDSIWIGEAVVSVVTTKSVVNGTISIPETTSSSLITEPVLSSPSLSSLATTIQPSIHTTDDSSIILASVQTSRSVSGARFLPFPVIDRVEELNLNGSAVSSSAKDTSLLSESTESIIDKLDERQSELSSGILVNGFRASGNTLQLDLPDRDRTTTRRRYGTTAKTPVINKLAPRRYNDKKLEYTPTAVSASTSSPSTALTGTYTTAEKPETASVEHSVEDMFQDVPVNETSVAATTERPTIPLRWPSRPASLPKLPGIKTTNRATTTTITTTTTTTSTPIVLSKIKNVKIQDVSAFLPPGYKLKKEESEPKEDPAILTDILAKSKVDISSFLPSDFNKKNSDAKEIVPTPKSTEPSISKEIVQKSSLSDLFAKSSVDISSLLPRDYKQKKINVTTGIVEHSKTGDGKTSTGSPVVIESTSTEVSVTPKKTDGGLKVVFPSRPGGRKPIYKITTPQSSRGEGVGHVTPRIQKGWPTRATTEFTGWPTSSTTPISIEKLLEAARTATIASMNASLTPTTSLQSSTSTTSTTTTTQRSTTPGVCEEECEVAGTIRIVGNATWVPELLDRNTHEWQDLANEIEREMNIVFLKSAVLKNWYKKIRIDSFSQGSILVDYFVELNNLVKKINTQELKTIFHESLKTHNLKQYNDTENKETMKFGKFTIDPKSTDFVVIPKVSIPQYVERDDRLIPQWAIAVIVIGVGGLLFIIVFGVSVLINRQNEAKLKPSISAIYEEEVAKNMMHANHPSSSHRSTDYPKQIHTIWNDPDVSWNDRSFESTSNKILVDRTFPDERKYNLYDSWRSEWNGYYYNASHPSNKYAGYDNATNLSSRHHSDYDTNF